MNEKNIYGKCIQRRGLLEVGGVDFWVVELQAVNQQCR